MTLPAFARECEWCHHHFDDHVAHWWHVDRDNLAAWMTASRARAMAGRSAIVEAVEEMGVDEDAWRGVGGRYYRGTVDPDAMPVFTGWADAGLSWCAGPICEAATAQGNATTERDARIAVQRAHFAHALSVCGSRTEAGR